MGAQRAELERVLVVGASLAGLRTAERIRAEGFDGELTVLGAESRPPYDRPPLSKAVLAGRLEPELLSLRGFEELDADWILGERAAALDLASRTVSTDAGRELGFDGLVIATGSSPRRLPALEPDGERVFELRTLDDALALRSALARSSRLAIVGAGFIGVEVASTARELGLEVEIVSLDPPLAIAGELISSIALEQLRDHGVGVHVRRKLSEVERGAGSSFAALALDDGTRIEADVVLVAIGARPATEWLAGSGLDLADGVACDACCACAGADRVVAVGDVARWSHPRLGAELRIEHWTNAVEGARAAAATLLRGPGSERHYAPVPSFWSDHFGTRVQSLGLPGRADRFEVIEGSIEERRFASAAYRGEELVGAVAYGLPAALLPLRAQLAGEAAVGAR